jgi:3'-5' exonuclease
MAKLVFDIETIGEDWDGLDGTSQHMLTRWIEKESADEEEFAARLAEVKDGLGFSPLTGSIVALGVYDVDRERGCVYYQAPGAGHKETEEGNIKFRPVTEAEMLEQFWLGAKNYSEFVTFNGRCFDVPFMVVRSAVHGIKLSKDLLASRYLGYQREGSKHVDLLDQLTFYGAVWRQKGSLHMWCRAFGIKSPKADGVDGDDVGRLFRDKRYLDIARYNVGDLYATAELYKKWNEFIRF